MRKIISMITILANCALNVIAQNLVIERQGHFSPDFVIAYPKKYKSYNFSRQECKKQGFSRIGGRACYFTRLFARLPKQQKQPLIIKHLQTYFEKVTKSGKKVDQVVKKLIAFFGDKLK